MVIGKRAISLGATLALPLFLRPSIAFSASEECPKVCIASVTTNTWVGTGFSVTVVGQQDGLGKAAYCAPCEPCKAGVNWAYVGTAKWAVGFWPGSFVSGEGPSSGGPIRIETKCDEQTSNAFGGYYDEEAGQYMPGFACDLFCICPP